MYTCSMCRHEKPDEEFAKPGGKGFFKTCDECRRYSRQHSKWYSETFPERRKRSRKAYKRSEKGKKKEKQYRNSGKGVATSRRAKAKYRASKKGRATERAYRRKHRERTYHRYADRIKARTAISNALRDNKITRPLFCELCGRPAKLHAHHHSGWGKECHLSVWWVCKHCDPPTGSQLPHDGSLTLEEARTLIIPNPVD